MKIKSLRQIKNLTNKTVFLRVDFNVPIITGKIAEDYKIKASLETIEFLQKKGTKIILASHLGEPRSSLLGKYTSAYSLKIVAVHLKKLLKQPVKFLPNILDSKTKKLDSKTKKFIDNMQAGDIAILENLRFYSGEYNNDSSFATQLASLADVYVNDAWAVSHRAQASVDAIKDYLPAYAGLLLEKEVRALSKILNPKKPLIVIMGGAKIASKIPLILKLSPIADQILVGGALANNFFKFQGLQVGKSLVDKNSIATLKLLYKKKKLDKKIILPLDVVVQRKNGQAKVLQPSAVQSSDVIYDIGPATIAKFAASIKTAKTLIWNGPLGFFEKSSFKHGTIAIATLLAARSSGRAYGLVGGGETVEALKLTKFIKYVDWVSTGGGAVLSYLGGAKMPGLDKIVSR